MDHIAGTEARGPDDRARRESARRDEIPSGGRLLLGWLLVLVSIVLLALGWYGVSGNPQVAVQLSYLASGGLGGLLAGIVGIGLLVSNDVRRDRERLGRVEAAMLELREMLRAQAEDLREIKLDGSGASAGDPSRAFLPETANNDQETDRAEGGSAGPGHEARPSEPRPHAARHGADGEGEEVQQESAGGDTPEPESPGLRKGGG